MGVGFNQPPTVKSGETATEKIGMGQNPEFQSAPDGEVGGDRPPSRPPPRRGSFNQPPTVKSGETIAHGHGCGNQRGFNQPPTVKSGETTTRTVARLSGLVSISPRR